MLGWFDLLRLVRPPPPPNFVGVFGSHFCPRAEHPYQNMDEYPLGLDTCFFNFVRTILLIVDLSVMHLS